MRADKMKKIVSLLLVLCMTIGLAGCAKKSSGMGQTEVQVFSAASLYKVMSVLAEEYEKEHPDVKIVLHADSSGTLLTQIREGYECDIFFSAAEKQMDMLKQDGFIVDGTRADVVNNQVVLITRKDSGTKVTGLDNLKDAKSIALAGGSVPVGKYTREALVNKSILGKSENVSEITTRQVSDALGGVGISEQDNVSKVLIAIEEGSCEVGTTYYSDIYGFEDKLEILEMVNKELTGDVRYPVCLVKNRKAGTTQKKAAEDFKEYIVSGEAKKVFESYYFDTDVDG